MIPIFPSVCGVSHIGLSYLCSNECVASQEISERPQSELNIHPSRSMNSKMFFLLLLCCSLAVGKGLVEGDIALRDGETLSEFLTHETKKWPNGQVKYYIDNSIVSQEHQDLIKDVIGDIEAAAKCINFQDIADEEKVGDHIRQADKLKSIKFKNILYCRISAHGDKSNSGVGCWSYPGRQVQLHQARGISKLWVKREKCAFE